MEETGLIESDDDFITVRLANALMAQQDILRSAWMHNAKRLDALHRFEVLLADCMEWDFIVTDLKKHEYEFLHLFTSYAGDLADKTDIHVTVPMLIEVLEAVLSTTKYIQERAEHNAEYVPEADPIAFQPRNKLKPIQQTLYDLYPVGIAVILNNSAARKDELDHHWLVPMLEHAINVLRAGNGLMKVRGLGDRE